MLQRYDDLITALQSQYQVETLAPRTHVIRPKAGGWQGTSQKPVSLSFTGLIHGTELAGLGVITGLLESIVSGAISIQISLGVAIGNDRAALQGQRFLERDLNRSFARDATSQWEDVRADDLERLLSQSLYLVDFHQVKLPIDRAFWIFPFGRSSFDFARAIAPDISLVTHWGKPFSADGQCSDEYVNKQGGTGITVELGQNGFDPRQIAHGMQIAQWAIQVVTARLSGTPAYRRQPASVGSIYTWAEIVPYPQTGKPVLDAGWHNFAPVAQGQRIGSFAGKDICAGESGFMLFPKYPDQTADGTYGDTAPAAELTRILREIGESNLPW